MKKLALLILSLMVIGSQNIAFAGTVSFDQLASSQDLTYAKYNSDLNRLYQEFNSNIESSNIAADTVSESDMADNANPRLRDYELGGAGTECEMVYSGLLPSTTSGTLVGAVPSGTAYPRGYRVVKSSSTPKTWTASKWTYVDIDIVGDLTYSEVAIDGSAPAVATNSIRLARVSTDGTQVVDVQDLRTLSCTSAKYSTVKEESTGASLQDLLRNGTPVRAYSQAGLTPQGWVQGLRVSYDTHATFKVTAGSAYINGEYRAVSQDISVSKTTNDAPSTGGSGLDTGSIAANTRYYVYAVGDQDNVGTLSATYSTSATTPTGLTNYRLIGSIVTDATSLFTSRDTVTVHALNEREVIGAWINYNATSTILGAYNVSSTTDNGAGDTTVTFDADFNNVSYSGGGFCSGNTWNGDLGINNATAPTVGAIRLLGQRQDSGAANDCDIAMAVFTGDAKR